MDIQIQVAIVANLAVFAALIVALIVHKKIVVQVCFVIAFLPFLRLSAWGSGFSDLSSMDAVSVGKTGIRLFTFSILAIYFLPRIRKFPRKFSGSIQALFIFLLFAGISIIYSSNAFYSAYRLLEHIGFLLFVITILLLQRGKVDTKKTINLLLYGCGVLVAIVWLTYFIAPTYAFRILGSSIPTLGGDIMHIHTLGIISATIYGVTLYRFLGKTAADKWRLLYLAIICITILTVILTRSRTSLIIAIVLTGMVVSRTGSYKTGGLIIVALLLTPFFDPKIVDAALSFWARNSSTEQLYSLSSRQHIWESVVKDVWQHNLLLGYGYQMLSDQGLAFYSTEYGFTRTNAHNTFVQTFAGLGLIGIVLLFLQICKTSLDLYRINTKKNRLNGQSHFELLLLFVTCMIASSTQYGIVGMTTPIVPIYMVVAVYASYWAGKVNKKVAPVNLRYMVSERTVNT